MQFDPVWAPFLATEISRPKIEKVQRRATKIVKGLKNSLRNMNRDWRNYTS